MSTQENTRIVKALFAALRRGDRQDALALCDEGIEWIIPGEDHWIFAITVRDGRLASIREYIDTQALAGASRMDRPD